MNEKVSVNTEIPSPYIENRGGLYRLKRKLTYAFAFRLLNRYLSRRPFALLADQIAILQQAELVQ